MRKFPAVLMRGGTSKGLMFLEEDLPAREEWDDIFVQCMGSPDPKQTGAEDVGMTGGELPAEVDGSKDLAVALEAVRGAACVKMGLAVSPEDASANSPGVPKVGFVAPPRSFPDLAGNVVKADEMDICARVISVFKCHKACPLTAASAISVAALIPNTIVYEACSTIRKGQVRVGHPSGVMTLYPYADDPSKPLDEIRVSGVAVQRTARRIMDGTIYLRK